MKKKKCKNGGRVKYATGTAIKNYMENPYEELQKNKINRIKAEAEAANNPLTQGLDALGAIMMTIGSQGMSGQGMGGKMFKTGANAPSSMQMPEVDFSGVEGEDIMEGGFTIDDYAAFGGQVGKVPVEVEGDEVAETPDGQMMEFKGPSHEQGGIDADLEPGTEIYSDRIKVKGKTMADRKKNRERKKLTLENLLTKNPTDALAKNSLKRTEQVNQIQENFDQTVQGIVTGIENIQKFAFGGTVGDPPTKRAKLLQRLQSLGIATDQTPETFQNLDEATVQGFLNTMFEQNPNIQRPSEAQATIAKLMQQEDAQVETIAKTKFQIAEDPVQEVVVPGRSRDDVFAETRKQLEAEGLDPNTGTFEFDGKMFSTRLSPTGGNSNQREAAKVIQTGSEDVLDADQYFKKQSNAYGGRVKYANGTGPGDPVVSYYDQQGNAYDEMGNIIDAAQFTFSPPKPPTVASKLSAGDFNSDITGLPVSTGTPTSTGETLSGAGVREGGMDFSGLLENLQGGAKKVEGVVNANDITAGDAIGMAGNLYSAFAPMKNTKDAFASMTPNINPYENYGQEGLKSMADAKSMVAGQQARAMKGLDLSRASQTRKGRNSARGVNQMRALDLAANLQGDMAANDLNASFTQMLMGLTTQEAGMKNNIDQVVMGGEGARDIADRQDLANYYTQLGRDKATKGEGIQQMGKDLNSRKQNAVIMNLLNQLSKYGITVDSDGQLSVKDSKNGK